MNKIELLLRIGLFITSSIINGNFCYNYFKCYDEKYLFYVVTITLLSCIFINTNKKLED
jgi:hypothetical protein